MNTKEGKRVLVKVGSIKTGLYDMRKTLLEISSGKVLIVEKGEYYTESAKGYSVMPNDELSVWRERFIEAVNKSNKLSVSKKTTLVNIFPSENCIPISRLLNSENMQYCFDLMLSNGAGIGLVVDKVAKVFLFVV